MRHAAVSNATCTTEHNSAWPRSGSRYVRCRRRCHPDYRSSKTSWRTQPRTWDETLADLQEISRGHLHPTSLTTVGIRPALTALARRCPIPVDLKVSTPRRLPEPIETAIYYIAAQALTNAAKHAHASIVHLDLTANAVVRLSVRDDGIGGADPSRGSGLTGINDRVLALEGTMKIVSPAGGGTQLLVETEQWSTQSVIL